MKKKQDYIAPEMEAVLWSTQNVLSGSDFVIEELKSGNSSWWIDEE